MDGLFQNGDIGAELRLTINWREHALSLRAGGEHIQVPGNWTNGIAPSISEAIDTFKDACIAARLSTEWVVLYGSHFTRAERINIDRELGFIDAPARKWRNQPQSIPLGFGPLTEARLVVSLDI